MPDNPTNGELAIMITNLTEKVEDGIKRTDIHFEKLNNKVGKNTKFRIMGSAIIGFLLIAIPLYLKYFI